MKKCLTYQSVVSTYDNNTTGNFSQRFIKNLHSYLPKLCPTELKVTSCDYIPTQEELSFFGTVDESETFLSLQRVRAKGQTICTKHYNDHKATSTNNHCIKTEKSKFFVITKILPVCPPKVGEFACLDTNSKAAKSCHFIPPILCLAKKPIIYVSHMCIPLLDCHLHYQKLNYLIFIHSLLIHL